MFYKINDSTKIPLQYCSMGLCVGLSGRGRELVQQMETDFEIRLHLPEHLISSYGDFYEDVFFACVLPFYGVYVFCRLA
jgi:hypothetical protein